MENRPPRLVEFGMERMGYTCTAPPQAGTADDETVAAPPPLDSPHDAMAALSSREAVGDDWTGRLVALQGLKGAMELNGREGVVHGSIDTVTSRYEVHLTARGQEHPARIVRVKVANLRPRRPTALSARPGAFKASYDWREVMEGQDLPRGLEVISSLDKGVPAIARISCKWRLTVTILDKGDGETNPIAPFRMDVWGDGTGKGTMVGQIQAALRAHFDRSNQTEEGEAGWPVLFVNGVRLEDPGLTIVTARMFGATVTCNFDYK